MENSTPVPTLTPIQKKLNVFNSVERTNERRVEVANIEPKNFKLHTRAQQQQQHQPLAHTPEGYAHLYSYTYTHTLSLTLCKMNVELL